MTLTTDLLVLGSGIAGQTAATAASEAGLDVILAEKTATLGGSTVMSGGWFAFSGTDEQRAEGEDDSTELFLKDMQEVGEFRNDTALLHAYLDRQEAAYRWLIAHGVRFREIEISSGQSAKRSHNSAIVEVMATLHHQFAEAGGTTLREHRAVQLLTAETGAVTGARLLSPAGEVDVSARYGVVLATGGFSRGEALLRIFAPEQLAAIPFGGKGNTGDGLRLAWRLGADMADMSFVSGTYGSHPDTGDVHELLTAYYMGAIIVNRGGERFTDESQSYKSLGRAVLREEDGLGIQIFDADVRAKSHPGIPLKDMDAIEALGHLHHAATLSELATLVGVDGERLERTIERYNAAIAANETDEQGRSSLCNGVGALRPIVRAPFYAYPAKSLMTTTYCGVKVNTDAQVIDVEGAVIDGLYAVGEVAGGFHGAAYMTGTSLGKGAIFGLHVAREAAARAEAQRDEVVA
ncbi:MAG: FAD-dependent oxidoreductase [Microbacterium sp.]|uniref:FAD-dependent oxidoreductase n=1 Tax=Microbacterium sp. TaxID=51671 RepID=UPI001ACC8720|nr:FAD-dependent oxidoreductase [Microbacterium sp.]MBN9177497.1 FAD-dependent oxidoreductase [Microbacterium sp.]